MKFVLPLLSVLATTAVARAHTRTSLELPFDARNVMLLSAKLAQYPVGSREITDIPNGNIEGVPNSEGIFATKLEVTFAYDASKSNAVGSGPDGQTYSWDDPRSTATAVISLPPSEIAMIENHAVSARDLIRFSVTKKTIRSSQAGFGHCEFNYETGMNVDSDCQETPSVIKKGVTVIAVDVR